MKVNINVPNNLSEITLGQYQKFLKIQENNKDLHFIQSKMIQIFCKIDLKFVLKMRYSDVEEIVATLNKMFTQKPELVTEFNLNNKEYGFVPDLEQLTLGEYIDIDTYGSDFNNIHIAMNVLYRPIDSKFKDKYTIIEYDNGEPEKMFDMPMDAVISSMFFFLNLGKDVGIITLKSLSKQGKIPNLQDHILQENGDGINQFLASLEETLQNLNISLN
tara:strand:+ start:73 stop:723 length:651 start_codon:yes stop_codon:yes gene_type:complete